MLHLIIEQCIWSLWGFGAYGLIALLTRIMVTYIFSSWGRKLLHMTQSKFEIIPILGMQFDTARPLYYCSNLYYTSKYHRYYDVWVKSPNDLRE